jgi:hypothetical protein
LNLVSGHVQLLQQEVSDPGLETTPHHRRRTGRSGDGRGPRPVAACASGCAASIGGCHDHAAYVLPTRHAGASPPRQWPS